MDLSPHRQISKISISVSFLSISITHLPILISPYLNKCKDTHFYLKI